MNAAEPEKAAVEGSPLPVAAEGDPVGPGAAVTSDASDALSILSRELYWAGDPVVRAPRDTGSVRERLHTFAHRMRIEAREGYPSSEPGLDHAPRLRRRVKRRLWQLNRFSTQRYDRLLGELADLNAQLAERLAETERELERLRGEHRDPEADA
jgi:hypothetical protein